MMSTEVLDPLGRGLDVQFSFFYEARRRLHEAISYLAKRDLNEESVEVTVALVEDSLVPGEFGVMVLPTELPGKKIGRLPSPG